MIPSTGRIEAGALALVLLALPARAQDLADQDVQDHLTEAVKAILPNGWTVRKTTAHATPPDWHTSHPDAGFLVEGGDGKHTFGIWFLPPDWIGIRKVRNAAPSCYWEGILASDKLKTITASSDHAFPERVHELLGRSLSTPSLVNGGYGHALKTFEGRLGEADRTAQALIRKHCTTPEQFAEAAHSLVVLGVPAKSVFLRAAREVEGANKDFFCSALGLMGGDDAIDVLCKVVTDPRVPDGQRKYAAMALGRHSDKRIIPALQAALKQLQNEDALGGVARSLTRFRHEPAGPDLLAAFRRITNPHYKVDLAQALAAVRYQKAAPEIEGLLKELRRSDKDTSDLQRRLELALLRLTGDWGQPGETIRLHVLPPRRAVVGQEMVLTIYVENIGTEPLWSLNDARPGLVINGKGRKQEAFFFNGIIYQFYPGEVHEIGYNLAADLIAPGRYTVQYEHDGARSNVAVVEVKAARP